MRKARLAQGTAAPCAPPEPRAPSLAAAQPRSPVTGSSPSSFLRCQSSPVTGTQLPKLNETKTDWLNKLGHVGELTCGCALERRKKMF